MDHVNYQIRDTQLTELRNVQAERKLQRVQEDRAIIRALLTSTGASDQTTMLRTCLLHTSPTQVFLPAKLRMGMIV